MLSLRSFTRSIPRNALCSSKPSIRRPLSTIRKPSLVQSQAIWRRPTFGPALSAFSTSQVRTESAGVYDQELSTKIETELQLEQETLDEEKKKSVEEFLETSQYTLVDEPGQEDIYLTRTFGNENIKISFSCSDANVMQEEEDEDDAFSDDADDDELSQPNASAPPANAARSKRSSIPVAPEDSVAPSDQEGLEESEAATRQEGDLSFPVHLYVTVTKPNSGALHIQTTAHDGFIEVQDVHYFADSDMAEAETAEKDWKRRGVYSGPPFENLDSDLQLLLERYLEERGINSELATFVPDLAELKEQKEYVRWLGNVKNFVDA